MRPAHSFAVTSGAVLVNMSPPEEMRQRSTLLLDGQARS